MAGEQNIRAAIERAFLAAVRAYTYHTPIAKGKYRLFTVATDLCRYLPDHIPAKMKDGRRVYADLSRARETSIYFLGEYERDITEYVRMLVREGETCIDAGANAGWYTTLLANQVGASGAVHAFEPVPATYEHLVENVELIGSPPNVHLNNAALGDEEKTLTINVFDGLATAHASLSKQGREDAVAFECRMITLDSYLEANDVGHVDFVKVDVEGSEMIFLRGADRLFAQETPPIFLMEMALEQTRHFGYRPDDLVRYIARKAAYDFYAIDEMTRGVTRIDGFAEDHIGANVFCIPKGKFRDRLGWVPAETR